MVVNLMYKKLRNIFIKNSFLQIIQRSSKISFKWQTLSIKRFLRSQKLSKLLEQPVSILMNYFVYIYFIGSQQINTSIINPRRSIMTIYLSESTVIPVEPYDYQMSITKKISNYIFRFDQKIGQGNFSKVYKGYHQLTNQQVAIKIIQLSSLKSPKLQQLLFSEIQVIQSLNHPNILKCYEVLKSQHNCYIITQLCNGGDLQTLLKRQKCLNQISASPYVADIYNGLLYLGERGIVHRDIKIANIFLHNGSCKIADFGFAKYSNNQNFMDLDIGSPLYMSPQGMIDHIYGMKTDIWAFGIIFYEFLHGKTPFFHCNSEYELKRAVVTPISFHNLRPDLSVEARQFLLKCLTVDYKIRPDAIGLKKDPYIQHILNMNKNRRGQNNLDSTSIRTIPYNQFEQLQRPETIPNQNYNMRQQIFQKNNDNNKINYQTQIKQQQINNPTANNYIQNFQHRMKQYHTQNTGQTQRVSVNRTLNTMRTMQKQPQAKEISRKQYIPYFTQQSLNKVQISPNRNSQYSCSFSNIGSPKKNDALQVNFLNKTYDKFLVPEQHMLKNKVISKNRSISNNEYSQTQASFYSNTKINNSQDNFDKMSSSSWYPENQNKKKMTKNFSYENVNQIQNNLNSSFHLQSNFVQNTDLTQTLKVQGSFDKKSLKKTEKIQNSIPISEFRIITHEPSPTRLRQYTEVSSQQESLRSSKKFGQIIKGEKKPDMTVKSVIKIHKGSQSQSNLVYDRPKIKSQAQIDEPQPISASQFQKNNKNTWRHSYTNMNPLFESQSLNQPLSSTTTNKMQPQGLIQENQRSRPQINRNLICSIIEFKEAVGLLHYCRLYYRFIETLKKILEFLEIKNYDYMSHLAIKSGQIIEVFSRFLLTVLNELMENIRSKEILFEGEVYQKKKMKEDKLKQVTEEYFKKYMQQLNKRRAAHQKIIPEYIKSTSISFMREYNKQLWEWIDRQLNNLNQINKKTKEINQNVMKLFRNLCYFSLRILEANEIIINCIHIKNYKMLAQTMIENWLGQEYYSEQFYLKLKGEYVRKGQDMSLLQNSATNDTETENISRVNNL